MRWKARRLRLIAIAVLFFCIKLKAQNCIPTGISGTTINLACNQVCTNLNLKIPHVKGSSDYVVSSIPYAPYAFVTGAPSMFMPCANQDDKYYDVTPLPFTFCFYDSTYNRVVVSTNGSVTFDVSNALRGSNYLLNGAVALPYEGTGNQGTAGTCPSPSGVRLPQAGIFGVFCDIIPQASDGTYKIESRVEGTSPCRKFVVSFSQVQMFGCSAFRLTSQIVLHESTGLVEIFIQNKPFCNSNSGLAIVGIQNHKLGTPNAKGLTAPGRGANNGPWSTTNEAWRFTPAGQGSRFVKSELLTLGGTLVSTADTTTTTAGLLDLNFLNVCPPPGTTQYVIRTTFSSCSDPGLQLISLDTITFNRVNNLNATAIPTSSSCGTPTGTITVTVPPGAGVPPFQYALNAGPSQANNVFNGLSAGTYTVNVTDALGCSSTLTAIITQNGVINASTFPSGTSCPGVNNGSVLVNSVTSGNIPYTFVLDGGAQTINGTIANFTNLAAGNHTVQITDAGGCSTAIPISFTITTGPALNTTANKTDALCNGSATGTITVVQPTTGTPPYQYSLDGINWQSSNTFNGLPSGTYTVRFRESNGCQGQLTINIGHPPLMIVSNTFVPVVCNGQSNGTITIVASGGVAPYQYSVDGINWQSGNAFSVPAGIHTISIRDNNLCTTTQTVTVTEPSALSASTVTTNATCNGGPNGSITVTANGGNTNYQYSLNGGSFQSSNTFNVLAGNHTITVRDNLGCSVTLNNIVVNLTNDLMVATPVKPTICEGTSTQLQINSNAIQYAWAPTTGLSNPAIANPTANPTTTTNYIVTLTRGGCSIDVPVTVNVNPAPIPDAGPTGFICFGQSHQLQASGGTRYTWTPSNFLDSDTIFSPVATPDTTITYTLSVIDGNGCYSLVTDTVTVDVTPPITVHTFPIDTIVYQGDQFQISAKSIATYYLWTPSIGLSDPSVSNPIVTAGVPGDETTYKVVASTFAGCKGIGYVKVRVYKGPDIYMPSGFTPNNDGKNDLFRPFTVGIKQINYFKVFNRWGQELYSTKTLHAGWDGRLGGVIQATGVYVWMVEGVTNDDRVIRKKGTVTLIR